MPKAVMGKLYMYEGNKIYHVKLNKSGKILRVKESALCTFSLRVIDTAFCPVNVPIQPTRGAAPYFPKNY